jgi:hypothetical protein
MWALTKSTGVSSQEYSHALVWFATIFPTILKTPITQSIQKIFCFSVNKPACQGGEFLYAAVA